MSSDFREGRARTGSPFAIRLARALWGSAKLLFVEVIRPFLWRAALWIVVGLAFYRMMDIIEDSFPRPATDIGDVLEKKLCAGMIVGGVMVLAEAVTSSAPITGEKLARRWLWWTTFLFWMVGRRAAEDAGIRWLDYTVLGVLLVVALYSRWKKDSGTPRHLHGTRSVA